MGGDVPPWLVVVVVAVTWPCAGQLLVVVVVVAPVVMVVVGNKMGDVAVSMRWPDMAASKMVL